MPSIDQGDAIESYLERLRKGLRHVPAEERDEMIAEIRSHVVDRVEAAGDDPGALERVLGAVGDPGELAAQFDIDALLRRAAASRSPWVLLRTTGRWAGRGVSGLLALLLAVLGYGSALVCYVCAIVKPLFPSHIGVWLTPEHALTVGYWSGRLPSELIGLSAGPRGGFAVLGTFGPTQGPVRELLGLWLTPAGIVAGFLCAFVTTSLVRLLIRRKTSLVGDGWQVRG